MPAPRYLDSIPYPVGVAEYLADRDARYSALTVGDVPRVVDAFLNNRGIDGFMVPERLMPQYLVCLLADLLNGIVDSFNTINADLEELAALAPTLRGSPSVRLELLVRVFWSEAYRGKELVFKVAVAMRKRGYITRDHVRQLRDGYEEYLKDLYEVRHGLQHGEDGFKGEALNALKAVEAALRSGHLSDKTILLTLAHKAHGERAEGLAGIAYMFRQVFATTVVLLSVAAGLEEMNAEEIPARE
ncbi:MAG: hypothetical protein IT177_18915 [Acidobacteria bacterium]|nr:hypothetical protein [Acidobacteriota bacterium]